MATTNEQSDQAAGENEGGDISDVLNYDFFSQEDDGAAGDGASEAGEGQEASRGEGEPGSEGQQEAEASEGQPGQEGEQGASGQEESEGGDQPSEADNMKAQLAELQRQNAVLQQQLQEKQQAGGQQQGSQQQAGGQGQSAGEGAGAHEPSQEELQRIAGMYNVPVQQEILQAIQSDDANTVNQGIQRLVQGIGFHTHRQVMSEAEKMVERRLQQQAQQSQAEASQQTEAQRIHSDFYGQYPQFDKQGMHEVVMQTAREKAQELGLNQWSPLLRDETAKAVSAKLQAWGVQPEQSKPKGPGTKPNGKPAKSFNAGNATRGGHQPADANGQAEITDTLFG